MQEYLNQVRHLQSKFNFFSLQQIPRSINTHATLATSSTQSSPLVILVEDLCKFIEMKGEKVHIHQIRVELSWMDHIVLFPKDDILLEEKGEANQVWRKVPQFWLSKDQKLYKPSLSGALFVMRPP